MYNHEFTECQHLVNKDLGNMSQEDLKLIEILKNRTGLVGGYYQVPLPFRKDEVNLPNNRSQAEKRFACLKKRLCRNNLKWDEPIDDDTAQEWLKWRSNLMTLDGKSIARCLKPENFGNVVRCM